MKTSILHTSSKTLEFSKYFNDFCKAVKAKPDKKVLDRCKALRKKRPQIMISRLSEKLSSRFLNSKYLLEFSKNQTSKKKSLGFGENPSGLKQALKPRKKISSPKKLSNSSLMLSVVESECQESSHLSPMTIPHDSVKVSRRVQPHLSAKLADLDKNKLIKIDNEPHKINNYRLFEINLAEFREVKESCTNVLNLMAKRPNSEGRDTEFMKKRKLRKR